MCAAKGALKTSTHIIFIWEIGHAGTHIQLRNNAFPEKHQVQPPQKFVKGSSRLLTFPRAREPNALFPSTAKGGTPIGG